MRRLFRARRKTTVEAASVEKTAVVAANPLQIEGGNW
jgi:hypothetical protein